MSTPGPRSSGRGPDALPPLVVLIGLRGAGKTTVGRLLAAALRRPFLDLDDLALARLGRASVRDVFSALGEPAWREAESLAFERELRDRRPSVLALGGGAPMVEAIAARLADARAAGDAAVVWLACDAAAAAQRLAADPGDRPSLSGRGITDELEELLRTREPRYRALATHRVDASLDDPATVADAAMRALQAARSSQR